MNTKNKKFQGYLWQSDQNAPTVYYDEELKELDDLDNLQNPFIIEGQLCNGETSYSIKYVDGKYLITQYDLRKLEEEENKTYTPYSYLPNRINSEKGKIEKLIFHQYWEEESTPSPECENMKTLKPAELVFRGFNKAMDIKK